MKTLHIIRTINDPLVRSVIEASREEDIAVLLMQDAVYGDYQIGTVPLFACREDLAARQIEKRVRSLSYDEVAELVAEYERTIVW
ncbi:MAG: hypothetical protein HY200_11135 [Nitrospirae bacterium]|nr:hypothetical protein [Nitrospirota bacterium]MBI3595500.1 hypothetical protein [Nitrospirota bacterium]